MIKAPTTGAWFGLLPGGGSFYAREPGVGVLDLLSWPLSIFWDPVNGYDGAKLINYYATKRRLKTKKQQELLGLEEHYSAGQFGKVIYLREKKKIEDKYDFEVSGYANIGIRPSYEAAENISATAAISSAQGNGEPSAAGSMSKGQWQEQQLQILMNEKGISYEEYQRRYRAITGQQ